MSCGTKKNLNAQQPSEVSKGTDDARRRVAIDLQAPLEPHEPEDLLNVEQCGVCRVHAVAWSRSPLKKTNLTAKQPPEVSKGTDDDAEFNSEANPQGPQQHINNLF